MIADLLPENKRAEDLVLRVVGNLSWIIGPTIGGLVAARSFRLVCDRLCDQLHRCRSILDSSGNETRNSAEKQGDQSYPRWPATACARDYAFMAFIICGILMLVVYQQLYNTLSVYLRDVHNLDPRRYGFLLTTSAITVVLFQFSVTRWIRHRPPFVMIALGTLFYAIGFGMFGFVKAYALFALAVIIITVGEMISVPTSQSLATNFAPEDMRGRYMAMFGLGWAIPQTIGPAAAGMIIDNLNPNLLWYIGGLLCIISAFGYLVLHARLGRQKRFAPAPREPLVAQAS